MTRLIVVLVLSTLSGLTMAGGMYQWTDEQGRTHFSDTPPPDVEAEHRELRSPANIGDREGRAAQDRTLRMLRGDRDREDPQAERSRQMEQRQREQECREARNKVSRLQGRVQYLDDEGNRIEVSRERVKRDREELQTWIRRNC